MAFDGLVIKGIIEELNKRAISNDYTLNWLF